MTSATWILTLGLLLPGSRPQPPAGDGPAMVSLEPYCTFTHEEKKYFFCLAFSPDGKSLAAGSQDGATHVWDVASKKKMHALGGRDDWVEALAFSPDGKWLAAGGGGFARVWDLQNGKDRALTVPEM